MRKGKNAYLKRNPLFHRVAFVAIFGAAALMLSLTVRLYRRYHTLDLDEISLRLEKEGL